MGGMVKDSENVMARLNTNDIAQIDKIYPKLGFKSRSAFIRDAVEKALNPNFITIELTDKELKTLEDWQKKRS